MTGSANDQWIRRGFVRCYAPGSDLTHVLKPGVNHDRLDRLLALVLLREPIGELRLPPREPCALVPAGLVGGAELYRALRESEDAPKRRS